MMGFTAAFLALIFSLAVPGWGRQGYRAIVGQTQGCTVPDHAG